MIISPNNYDIWKFAGAAGVNGALANSTAWVTAVVGTDRLAVTAPATGHGLKANTKIYLQGTTNYDGIRSIVSVATNTFTILVPDVGYVAETAASTDYWFPAMTFDEPWEFKGFKIHFSAAHTTDENLSVSVDAIAGTYWDYLLYQESVVGQTDVVQIYDTAIPMNANDLVKVTLTNTDTKTWGLELIGRPLK